MDAQMKKKIKSGKAMDLAYSNRTPEGYYIINHFLPEKDYCDSFMEVKIAFILKDPISGKHYALTQEQYDSANLETYELVWFR